MLSCGRGGRVGIPIGSRPCGRAVCQLLQRPQLPRGRNRRDRYPQRCPLHRRDIAPPTSIAVAAGHIVPTESEPAIMGIPALIRSVTVRHYAIETPSTRSTRSTRYLLDRVVPGTCSTRRPREGIVPPASVSSTGARMVREWWHLAACYARLLILVQTRTERDSEYTPAAYCYTHARV